MTRTHESETGDTGWPLLDGYRRAKRLHNIGMPQREWPEALRRPDSDAYFGARTFLAARRAARQRRQQRAVEEHVKRGRK